MYYTLLQIHTTKSVFPKARVVIEWQLELQLPMQSVPITTNVVSSNPVHGELYSIQLYVIKFVSDLRQFGDFFPGTSVSSTNKTDCNDITEILLKVALNTINHNPVLQWVFFQSYYIKTIKTYISNLLRTTRFRNNLRQVKSQKGQKGQKVKKVKVRRYKTYTMSEWVNVVWCQNEQFVRNIMVRTSYIRWDNVHFVLDQQL